MLYIYILMYHKLFLCTKFFVILLLNVRDIYICTLPEYQNQNSVVILYVAYF
jgi:hypothetical protein